MIPDFTPPRRRALAVLAHHGRARVSKRTCSVRRTVYWQTAKWLVDAGLAEDHFSPTVTLTDIGRDVAGRVLGISPVCA